MNFLQSAKTYKDKGLSVISTDNNKRSLFSWKKYQHQIASDDDLAQLFNHPKAQGIAVICGAVSGNLEVIDVDCKYGIDFATYANKIKEADADLYNRLLIIKTKSNGYHIYYRCEVIEGNQKLANRPPTDDELHHNPNVKECVLIETRGEGGYVIAPPTSGYDNIQGKDIPIITIDERDTLLTLARQFNQIFEEARQPHIETDTEGLTVWEDYNQRGDIISLLEKHGWAVVQNNGERVYFRRPGATSVTSANFHTGLRVFYVFTTSSQFQNKGYSPFAVYALLECNGDFKKAAKQLSSAGYGEKRKHYDQPSWFWEIGRRGAISILKYKLEKFLFNHGYGLYFHDPKSNIFRLIHEDNRKVKEVNTENIKKFIKDKIERSNDIDADFKGQLLEVIYKQAESLFNQSFFEFLPKKDVDILRDEASTAYFPFRNGIVVINGESSKLVSYANIDKCIWESQITNFDIQIDEDYEMTLCKYFEFIQKISGDDDSRIHYALTLIGYILHSYKDPSKPFAPILAEETDDEAKGGGTGKGIFFHAISKLIPTVRIDGKNFKPDKTFAFQRVTLGTRLVVIEDCPKNVDFEKYYPTITEGMTVEKKNKDELFLSYNESPKIAFTTNYSIAANAEHAKRRQKVFEFAPFFSSKNTPLDYFGEKLFDDWDADEWNRFYNLMFLCVSLYLKHGVLSVDNSEKLKRKQIKLSFGEEFLEHMDDLLENGRGNWKTLNDEWKGFLLRNELDKKDYSLKRYKKALAIGCKVLELELEEQKNWQNGGSKEFRIK